MRRKRLWLPLTCYLGITVVVPLLNGAVVDDPFLHHALITGLVAGAIVALFAGIATLANFKVRGILRRWKESTSISG